MGADYSSQLVVLYFNSPQGVLLDQVRSVDADHKVTDNQTGHTIIRADSFHVRMCPILFGIHVSQFINVRTNVKRETIGKRSLRKLTALRIDGGVFASAPWTVLHFVNLASQERCGRVASEKENLLTWLWSPSILKELWVLRYLDGLNAPMTSSRTSLPPKRELLMAVRTNA